MPTPTFWPNPLDNLWSILISGVWLRHDGPSIQVCGHPQPFQPLFQNDETAWSVQTPLMLARLWHVNYRWDKTVDAFLCDLLAACSDEEARSEASSAFAHPIAPEHRHDTLLAYAWWAALPDLTSALQARGVVGRWRGESLLFWCEQTVMHPTCAQRVLAQHMLVQHDAQQLRTHYDGLGLGTAPYGEHARL